MKKFTKVCLIISTSFFGVGLILSIAGAVSGGGFREVGNMMANGDFQIGGHRIAGLGIFDSYEDYRDDLFDHYEDDGNYTRYNGGNFSEYNEMFEKESLITDKYVHKYSFKDIQKLDVSVDAGLLKIQEYDGTDFVVATTRNDHSFECKQDGTTLNVEDERRIRDYDGELTVIFIPSGRQFQEVDISLGAGRIRVGNLSASKLEIDIQAGEFKSLGTLSASEAELSVKAGDMQIERFDGSNIDITCDVGSIALAGKITGYGEVNCEMGEIRLDLEETEPSYNYLVSCSVGGIQIGDNSFTGLSTSKKIDNGAANNLRLTCNMGNIQVLFK
jgi:hypothetical protein